MKSLSAMIMVPALLAGLALPATGQVKAGISVGPGGVESFYLSIGSYFRVPEAEVAAVRSRYRIADEELPVVFFLAARAHIAPSVIMDLRIGGTGWFAIASRYHLPPDVFFVPVAAGPVAPPYGNAYGHYRKYLERHEWGRVLLSDREVVDLVNLRFISEYHKTAPVTIMSMRAKGSGFVAIHEEVVRGKGKTGQGARSQPGKGKDKGKGQPTK